MKRLYYQIYRNRLPLALYVFVGMIFLPLVVIVGIVAADSIPAALFVTALFAVIGWLVRLALTSA